MYELITIDISTGAPKGLGCKLYKTHPRIGEWVEITVGEIGKMFEVVMVAHSSEGCGSDVYLKMIGDTTDAIKGLCK